MSQGLLPCPFCGNEHPEIASGDSVICNGIDGETCWASNMFEMWNRRAPLAWTSDPPTVPGDYLCVYRFEPEDDWIRAELVKLTADKIRDLEPDTSDTRWFGPIPPIEGGDS